MPSHGKMLMDVYHAEAQAAAAVDDYSRKFVMDTAEDLVNGVHHGLPASDYLPRLRHMLESNAALDFNTPEESEHYLDTVRMLDAFAAEQNIPLN